MVILLILLALVLFAAAVSGNVAMAVVLLIYVIQDMRKGRKD